MELSTLDREWGQKEISKLIVSIYEPDENCMSKLYATVVLDKNTYIDYQISNTGKRKIVVETTIMNPVLYNALLNPDTIYYYSITAEDIVRTLDGENHTIRTEYGKFPIAELEWVVNPDTKFLTTYEIRFLKEAPYHWAV